MSIILSAKASSYLHKWESCGDSSRTKATVFGIAKSSEEAQGRQWWKRLSGETKARVLSG